MLPLGTRTYSQCIKLALIHLNKRFFTLFVVFFNLRVKLPPRIEFSAPRQKQFADSVLLHRFFNPEVLIQHSYRLISCFLVQVHTGVQWSCSYSPSFTVSRNYVPMYSHTGSYHNNIIHIPTSRPQSDALTYLRVNGVVSSQHLSTIPSRSTNSLVPVLPIAPNVPAA